MTARPPEWTVIVVLALVVAVFVAVLTWGDPIVPVPFDDTWTPNTQCCPVETSDHPPQSRPS